MTVRFEDIDKRYVGREVLALTGINLTIEEGEFVSLLGPSGCGKSTLLKILAGLLPASAGRVMINSTEISAPGPDRAVVFQDYALFPWMTVEGNVEFGLEARGIPAAERRQTSTELLALVGLSEFATRYPHHLSGGMKQRVAIARALAVAPEILLMDEPFGALDAQTRSLLQNEVLRIWELYKKTILFVTHAIDEAVFLSDRVVIMTARPGQIKEIITIDAQRPRDLTSPEMSAVLRQVRAVLADEINRAAALEQADLMAAS
jgi:ABC-type nitrate/sulfonate/bicarbonate transport system ATPase subunit